jgi:hypothetical protein
MAEHPIAKSYAELPEHVRLMLENLSEEQAGAMPEVMGYILTVKAMGKIWKWAFILTVSFFAGAAAIAQAIDYFAAKIRGL